MIKLAALVPRPRAHQSVVTGRVLAVMRTGIAPGGYVIKPSMPSKQTGMFDDVELAATYQSLRSLN